MPGFIAPDDQAEPASTKGFVAPDDQAEPVESKKKPQLSEAEQPIGILKQSSPSSESVTGSTLGQSLQSGSDSSTSGSEVGKSESTKPKLSFWQEVGRQLYSDPDPNNPTIAQKLLHPIASSEYVKPILDSKLSQEVVKPIAEGINKGTQDIAEGLHQAITAPGVSEKGKGVLKVGMGAINTLINGTPSGAAFSAAINALNTSSNENIKKGTEYLLSPVSSIVKAAGAKLDEGSWPQLLSNAGDLVVFAAGVHYGTKYGSFQDFSKDAQKVADKTATPEEEKKVEGTVKAMKNVSLNDIVKEGAQSEDPAKKQIAADIKDSQPKVSPEIDEKHQVLYDLVNKSTPEELAGHLDNVNKSDDLEAKNMLNSYVKTKNEGIEESLPEDQKKEIYKTASEIDKLNEVIGSVNEEAPLGKAKAEKYKADKSLLEGRLSELAFPKSEEPIKGAMGEPEGQDNVFTHPETVDSKNDIANSNDSNLPERENDKLTPAGEEEAKKIDLTKYPVIFRGENDRVKQTVDLAQKTEGVKVVETPLLNTGDIGDKEGTKESEFNEKEWIDSEDGDKFKPQMEEAYKLKEANPDAAFVTHSKVARALKALKETDGKWDENTTKKYLELGEKEKGEINSDVKPGGAWSEEADGELHYFYKDKTGSTVELKKNEYDALTKESPPKKEPYFSIKDDQIYYHNELSEKYPVSKERFAEMQKNNENLKLKQNALQKPSTGEVLQRTQSGTGEEGGKRGGVEQVQQGNEASKKAGEKQSEEEFPEKAYIKKKIAALFDLAQKIKDRVIKEVIRSVTKEESANFKTKTGLNIGEDYNHAIDNYSIIHILKEHGDSEIEKSKGQLPVTKEDIQKIPEIIDSYDNISKGKNERGQDVIKYDKTYPDGTTYYFEEVRTGKKELAAETMYKKQGNVKVSEGTLKPNVQDDSLNNKGSDNTGNPKNVGSSHQMKSERAQKQGLPEPEYGEGLSVPDAYEHGKRLVEEGADADKVAADFKKSGKLSKDDFAVIVARDHELKRAEDAAFDKGGKDSDEYKEAHKKAQDWQDNTLNPAVNFFHHFGQQLQYRTQVDTGSFAGLVRHFKEEAKREPTKAESDKIKELSEKVKSLTEEQKDIEKKHIEEVDRLVAEGVKKSEKKNRFELTDEEKAERKRLRNKFSGRFNDITSAATILADKEFLKYGKLLAKEAAFDFTEFSKKAISELGEKVKPILKEWFDKSQEEKEEDKDLFTKFADKKDSKFAPEDVKDIWNYAKKEYLDKDKDYLTMLTGVSTDLGLTTKQVREAISMPKQSRVISDDIWRKQAQRQQAVNAARDWVKEQSDPKLARAMKSIPNFFFGVKTLGHGTVGAFTHAGTNMFIPSRWHAFFPSFLKQFSFAFGDKAAYEKAMFDLKNDPDYIFARRSGLVINPDKFQDDYQANAKKFGKLGEKAKEFSEIGERGFNALKVLRLELFKKEYNSLPESVKADPNTAKQIAEMINNSTGTTTTDFHPALNVAFFAPKLEASRWKRLVVTPVKAMETLIKGKDATVAEKAAAKLYVKTTAQLAATLVGSLVVNQGLLKATGSDQDINFFDPTKSDWMKFKVAGKTVDLTSGMTSTIKFISNMILYPTMGNKDLHGKKIGDLALSNMGQYLSGKLSPFGGVAKDAYNHHDYSGNTLPWMDDKPQRSAINPTAHKLTWAEYLTESQTPIPISEATKDIYDGMRKRGMSESLTEKVLNAIVQAGISGSTGIKVREDFEAKKKENRAAAAKKRSDFIPYNH